MSYWKVALFKAFVVIYLLFSICEMIMSVPSFTPSITSFMMLLRFYSCGAPVICPSKFESFSSAVSNGLLSFSYPYDFIFNVESPVSFRPLVEFSSSVSLVDVVSVSV